MHALNSFGGVCCCCPLKKLYMVLVHMLSLSSIGWPRVKEFDKQIHVYTMLIWPVLI